VYAILVDYHDAHPRILPNPPFVGLEVERGGTGTGTIFLLRMKAMGRTQTLRGTVTEPEPGRTVVETYDSGIVTTFVVEPRDEGRSCSVTITTVPSVRTGVAGAIARWLTTQLLRPALTRELANVAAAVEQLYRQTRSKH